MERHITDFLYLISIVVFIFGMKGLSSPATARKGNLTAAAGMGLAILIALFSPAEGSFDNHIWIIAGMVVGSAIGLVSAKRVAMTKMPEMVSLFNGLGGATAMLIGFIELKNYQPAVISTVKSLLSNGEAANLMNGEVFSSIFALIIGAVSFSGSLIAWGKLNGSLRDNIKLPAPQIVNLVTLTAIIALSVMIMNGEEMNFALLLILTVLGLFYGVAFVSPIGGGDMPVVISLLNSFTGVGAAVAGLIYGNNIMIIGGILVGASGTILTVLMCEAMNRSLISVIIGGLGSSGSSSGSDREEVVKEATPADLAIQLKYSERVVIVPGYGLAVAQAQHVCHELEQSLEAEGVDVKYAIHPVAGRMPGHMNVLLAESDVDYDKLMELEPANDAFNNTDVVLVIGANDVVNPAAKTDTGSPIYGMPILDVEQAKNVIVFKRSMSTGYAGIQNPLFFGERTKMLFGDAKASLGKLKEELNNA
ncbi:NAD(P)(+) transhydrogenase (Re/Si-specific) subunit beta [Persicobacter sp. CCB-QB2]|uniref:NAD(P)(+) transhydrogenase (Re/Si-specific) subunit beta n=1 Tax=Persicobacter sp. CCB-QB2 TaxID=1561025 RepID=UPI0006A9EA52|nr:NAD(P)(+) transhydrogenase (Re/Si-specific) subunit beta [Persicobacter sp. CCB-QB2]